MKGLEALGLGTVLLVLLGTPTAVFAGQRFLNSPPHEYTIVAHTVRGRQLDASRDHCASR